MLNQANVQPMLPVKDLQKAVRFYRDTLGLEQVGDESEEAVAYRTGDTILSVYRSQFAGTNKGTAALWEVPDVEETVGELRARGVEFEHYDDLPDVTRVGDVHRADGLAVAWFKDPDGNILSIQNMPGRA
ncbi:MAG: VOC family protein [Gemmatimonas sp.]|nr:VOC family protein [Gemmatimonas sp.]